MKILLLILWSVTVLSGVSSDVLIRGKIGAEFDERQVKVIDSFGQSYFLPREVFPKDFVIKQGESFTLEINDEILDKVKVVKKQK
jgi:hypothetical protein